MRCFLGVLFLVAIVLGGSAKAVERPNILFAISDDQSFPHTGAYGCKWVKTPAFDRVAREGLLFTRAYTPNAKCSPSRACILTGRNSWQLEAAANHMAAFPKKFKVYPEVLIEHGYHVGYTGKGWAPGSAKGRQLTGPRYSKRTLTPPTKAIFAGDYAANFKDFLDANSDDKPWCFWFGAKEPHRRYEYGSGVSKGGKSLDQLDRVPAFWPDLETVRNDMLDYAFEIEHFDKHLQRMLKLLEERGKLDNTLVVVTSDNGMPFPRIKGQAFESANHLPLAIMWPKGIKKPGRAVDLFVSFIDFAPTFIELAGLDWSKTGMQPTPGESLTDLFAGETSNGRGHVLIGKERHDTGRPGTVGYPIRGIVTRDWLYLHNYEVDRWPAGDPVTGYPNCDGSPTKSIVLDLRRSGENTAFWKKCFGKRPPEQFYKLGDDPDCVNNLANNATHQATKLALKKHMESALKQQGDPRIQGRGEVFDQYRMPGHGYYERQVKGKGRHLGWLRKSDYEPNPE